MTSYVTTLNEILIKCPILSNKVWLDIVWFFFNYIKEQWNVKQNWFESENELNVTIKFNFNPKINAKWMQ